MVKKRGILYYTVKEYADATNYSTSTIYSWIKRNRIRYIKNGDRYLIPAEVDFGKKQMILVQLKCAFPTIRCVADDNIMNVVKSELTEQFRKMLDNKVPIEMAWRLETDEYMYSVNFYIPEEVVNREA